MTDRPMPRPCPCGRSAEWCELERARAHCAVASAELRGLPQPRFGVGIVGTTRPIVVLSRADAARVVDLICATRPDRWVEARDLSTQEVVIRREPSQPLADNQETLL